MKTICKRLLITLLIFALPTMANAVESATSGDQKALPLVKPAQNTPASAVPKSPDLPASQAVVVTPPNAPQALAPPVATPPPLIVNPQPAPQISISQPGTAPAGAGATQMATEPLKAQTAVLVGFVDLYRINADSDPGKAGQTKLVEKKKKLQAQVETRKKQLDKLKESIEAQMPSIPPEQREAKSREFRKKVEEFQKFGQNAENEFQKMQQELSRSLYTKVEQAAAEYAKSNNLTMVIASRDLLYKSGMVIPMDVTDGVVKLINEMKKGKKEKKK